VERWGRLKLCISSTGRLGGVRDAAPITLLGLLVQERDLAHTLAFLLDIPNWIVLSGKAIVNPRKESFQK
jgi:hypothetical protein